MNPRVPVRRAFDLRFRLTVQRRRCGNGAQRPTSGASRREADLPYASAVIKSRNSKPHAFGTCEISAQFHVEGVPADRGAETEIVGMVTLHRNRGGQDGGGKE